jgi:Carboxysome shell peptide mid-region
MSQAGKREDRSRDRTRAAEAATPRAAPPKSGGCSCGGHGTANDQTSNDQTSAVATPTAPIRSGLGTARSAGKSKAGPNGKLRQAVVSRPQGRLVSQARRAALSTRGRVASATPSAASLERQANPQVSGRTLARKIRERRSNGGSAGLPKTQPTGRMRPNRAPAGAEDQPWKVGAGETARGQMVTGTQVGRSRTVTGDEPSTCRTITGTEYMGADIFREFCQTQPSANPAKVRVTRTGQGNRVTGNEVGRSAKVTGDEPGTCKNVTGTEYLSAEQQETFCGTAPRPTPRKVGETRTSGGRTVSGVMVGRSERVTGNEPGSNFRPTGTQYLGAEPLTQPDRVPSKVGRTQTLSGGTVTGTSVGRSSKVTGDEPGSCKSITGDQYLGAEQYAAFCAARPEPEAPKVGVSKTRKQLLVSGTQTGRSGKVTGDEPGTCKAVTGTPYAGLEQAESWCAPEQRREIEARTPRLAATPGARLTGLQPGIGGVMTGASRGACEPVTGTPYVGADQFAASCDAAQPGDGDFPRPFDAAVGEQPGTGFSVTSPAREAVRGRGALGHVTGTRYEHGGRITGPFDMGTGKVTGTEQFRFGVKGQAPGSLLEAPTETSPAGAQRSRITGEGQSAGGKITGDDWERGDRVTGTEGASAVRRNPSRPGPMSAMQPVARKRNESVPEPVSKVTGSSGSTDRGALITYSGGARG